MKKILTSLVSLAAIATIASADFSRVEMGGGLWQNTPTGSLDYTESTSSANGNYTSSEKSNDSAYAWLLIKHPIPILPNLRLEYTTLKDEGKASGKFEDFEIQNIANGSIDMTQYDAVLYYNILDNTAWTTLDIGLDVKFIDTDFKASGNIDIDGAGFVETSYTVSQTIALPMAYARVRVEIPATNIGLEVDGKYVSYDGSTVSDFRAKIDYTLAFVPVVQPAIEIGYRVQKFDLTYNDDQTTMKLDFSGMYAGLMLRF